jgi:2-polyprenyl-3-methyl-5-hydroxy-6-metoxy-1,4-benzoquinol methylase
MIEINYQQAQEYWRRIAKEGAAQPDFAAGINPRVPEGAHRFCREGQLHYFQTLVAPFIAGADVIDLGCGPATFSLSIAKQTHSVHGVDVAPHFIEAAKSAATAQRLHNATFEVDDFVSWRFTQRYHLAMLGSVLQYVGDKELGPLLARVHGALHDDGRVYVRVSVAAKKPWHKTGAYHVIYRNIVQYEEAFRRAGLRVVQSAPDHFYTYGDLFTGYFIGLEWLTLGLSRRSPRVQEALLSKILRHKRATLASLAACVYRCDLPVPHIRAQQFLLQKAI